jgi:hypothetical protein
LYFAFGIHLQEPDDEAFLEYVEELHSAVLESYTGLVHGLSAGGKPHVLMDYMNAIFHFLQRLQEDGDRPMMVTKNAV